VYNQLGNGIVNLNNARKISDFPIPFPLAQMITFMLLVHWGLTAFICAASVKTTFWAGLITFIVVFSFWCINYIAVELEQPFGDDANDLPLHDMMKDLNISLSQLLKAQAQVPPTFNFKEEHQKLGTSSHGIEYLMKEDELVRVNSVPQVGVNSVPVRDFGEELAEHHSAMPPMLHVTSTVDLNSNRSCDEMIPPGFGSGGSGQQRIPSKMDCSSPSSQRDTGDRAGYEADYEENCTSSTGYSPHGDFCARKIPPCLATVRRPGCSPYIGRHANSLLANAEVPSASNGLQIDASTLVAA